MIVFNAFSILRLLLALLATYHQIAPPTTTIQGIALRAKNI